MTREPTVLIEDQERPLIWIDPDPLEPTDVDRAYAVGFEDGWDSTKPTHRRPLLGYVLVALAGAIVGALLTAAVIRAAPRTVQTTERVDLSTPSSAGPSGAPLEDSPDRTSDSGQVTAGAPLPSPAARAGTSDSLATGWHFGDARYQLTVCLRHSSSCVTVTVRDFCGCPGGRVIDLSPSAFRRLAPLSRGVIFVTVSAARRSGPVPTPPATDVGP
jgi:hypothetical protein